jgi:AcrR family transcriptional regulator
MSIKGRYHSPLRVEQSAATHTRILEAAIDLLRNGVSLTYSALAATAGVQERTVYRHFPTKEELESEIWTWILDHLTHVDFSPGSTEELVSSMRRSFAGFDAGAPLIRAMLHSPEGLNVRLRQQPARRAMFESCVEQAVPGVSAQTRRRAAAALQVLYSAASWDLLRSFWDMTASESAEVVELAIRSLFDGLQAHVQAPTSKRRNS